MRLSGSLAGEEVVSLTTGWVMGYSPEYAALEGNPGYLEGLAELGGGTVLENPAGAFAHTLRGEGTTHDLWPYLLGVATLLLPIDVGVRRLVMSRRDLARARAWVLERLPRRPTRPVSDTPSPVSRLFEAKARTETRRAGERRPAAETTPSLPKQPAAPVRSQGRAATDEETLAGRLLKKKRRREENQDS